MKIGVPREIKVAENRVALVPAGAEALVQREHEVMIEKGAGEGSGFGDEDYRRVGARIVETIDGAEDATWKRRAPVRVELRR